MVYSGHTFSIIVWVYASLWALSECSLPYKRAIHGIFTLLNLSGMAAVIGTIIMTRMHYSFDIALALVLWALLCHAPFTWKWAQGVAGYFTKNGAKCPPTIENCG